MCRGLLFWAEKDVFIVESQTSFNKMFYQFSSKLKQESCDFAKVIHAGYVYLMHEENARGIPPKEVY